MRSLAATRATISPPVLVEDEAALANGRQMRAARDDADLLAGLGELGRQQPADRAGADHAYLHRNACRPARARLAELAPGAESAKPRAGTAGPKIFQLDMSASGAR